MTIFTADPLKRLGTIALFTVASSLSTLSHGAIIEVREGDRIQDAVNQAAPGDEIRVYPGFYSETVYVDKDDITLRGVVEGELLRLTPLTVAVLRRDDDLGDIVVHFPRLGYRVSPV